MINHPNLLVNLVDHEDAAALNYAIVYREDGILDMLLDHYHIVVDHLDWEGRSALLSAVEKDRPDILERLPFRVSEDFDINGRDRLGKTLYQEAKSDGCRRIILDYGAVPDV
ncbi:hypothetical protein BDW74DRAFT_153020 [Aspergillus multicolor]|uniref:uncharacterized protein n=1 Tax=Aspergillus multicolor TaxID=41759 RepID=UPI003CCE38E5